MTKSVKTIKSVLEDLVNDCQYLTTINQGIGVGAKIDFVRKEILEIILGCVPEKKDMGNSAWQMENFREDVGWNQFHDEITKRIGEL